MVRAMRQPQEAEQNINTAGAGASTSAISAIMGVEGSLTAPEAARKMTLRTDGGVATIKSQLHHPQFVFCDDRASAPL
jgi:hypothetical protein